MSYKTLLLSSISGVLVFLPLSSLASSTTAISVNPAGNISNGSSASKTMTPDGRYIVFDSDSNDVVPGDTNNKQDVFIRDTVTNTTKIVSAIDGTNTPGNDYSTLTTWDDNVNTVSSNGRYVVFRSTATNLVGGANNIWGDIYVRDTVTNTTEKVSVNNSGIEGDQDSYIYGITPDGRYVVFYGGATNLVIGDTNSQVDVFVRDLQNDTTTRVSVSNAGTQSNQQSVPSGISSDGRYIVFNSYASNLVGTDTNGAEDVFVRDTVNNTTSLVSVAHHGGYGDGPATSAAITPNGRYVLFWSYSTDIVAGDTNGRGDVFVRDLTRGLTILVTPSYGMGFNPNVALSKIVASDDADEGVLIGMPVGGPGGPVFEPPVVAPATTTPIAITSDGRYVLFESDASDLIASDTNDMTDVFVRDLVSNTTTRVSVNDNEIQSNNVSVALGISSDGQYVVFASSATNIAANDTNNAQDIFVRSIANSSTLTVSQNGSGTLSNSRSLPTAMSSDGRYVAFTSNGSNLTAGDSNAKADVFVRDTLDGLPYTDINGAFSLYYPQGLQYKNRAGNGVISVVFSNSGTIYDHMSPLITISKGPSDKSLSQIVSQVTQSYRKIFRNNYTLTTE